MSLREFVETVVLVLGIVGAIVLGAWLDRSTDADLLAAIEAHERERQLELVRQAWLAGLQEGEDRALFRQQRWLAEQEARP